MLTMYLYFYHRVAEVLPPPHQLANPANQLQQQTLTDNEILQMMIGGGSTDNGEVR